MAKFSILTTPAKSEPATRPAPNQPTRPTEPSQPARPAPAKPAAGKANPHGDMLEAKLRVHNRLIDELDLSTLDKLDEAELHRQIGGFVAQAIAKDKIPMSASEAKSFTADIVHEMTGLGPLEP